KRSSLRLTDAEEAYLLERYLKRWPPNLLGPVVVEDGYSVHHTSSDLPDETGGMLVVGRAALHEAMAIDRLMTAKRNSESLLGLFYPTATPPLSTLFQAVLYFDEVFLIHPGSTIDRMWGFHEIEDSVARERYKRSHAD